VVARSRLRFEPGIGIARGRSAEPDGEVPPPVVEDNGPNLRSGPSARSSGTSARTRRFSDPFMRGTCDLPAEGHSFRNNRATRATPPFSRHSGESRNPGGCCVPSGTFCFPLNSARFRGRIDAYRAVALLPRTNRPTRRGHWATGVPLADILLRLAGPTSSCKSQGEAVQAL
jgi:hypothetical protein